MNRKSLVAALALVASAGSVLADDITVDTNPFTSIRSRAEVQAELQQHRAAGVDVYADGYSPLASFRSGKSRAEVRAEYIAARDEVRAMTGEDSGSAWLSARRGLPQPAVLAGQPVNAQ